MKFRKKPVVIEAKRLEDPRDFGACQGAPDWFAEAIRKGSLLLFTDGHAEVTTLEGVMCADVGDWIIRGTKGEIYPCKPDIFAEIYEPAEPPLVAVVDPVELGRMANMPANSHGAFRPLSGF